MFGRSVDKNVQYIGALVQQVDDQQQLNIPVPKL